MQVTVGLALVLTMVTGSLSVRAQDIEPSPIQQKSVRAMTKFVEAMKAKESAEGVRKKTPQHKTRADYWAAIKEYLAERAYPYDTIDEEANLKAIYQRDAMPPARLRVTGESSGRGGPRAPASGAVWEYVGPRRLQIPYVTYYGPSNSSLGGRIGALAYHPTDINTIYLAAPAGGVWKTTNSGTTWTPIGGSFPVPYCSSVAVHPTSPNTVIVGMGDYDGGVDGGRGVGMMRSTNGGSTCRITRPSLWRPPAPVSTAPPTPGRPGPVSPARPASTFVA